MAESERELQDWIMPIRAITGGFFACINSCSSSNGGGIGSSSSDSGGDVNGGGGSRGSRRW